MSLQRVRRERHHEPNDRRSRCLPELLPLRQWSTFTFLRLLAFLPKICPRLKAVSQYQSPFRNRPNFLDLLTETRHQIYQELVFPKLHGLHIGSPSGNRLVCYSDHSIHTSILRVCKQIYQEASAIIFSNNNTKNITSKLYIYLVISGKEECGDIGLALKTLSSAVQFRYIRTCSLEIAWFPAVLSDSKCGWLSDEESFDLLRNKLKIIHDSVSQNELLKILEVVWP